MINESNQQDFQQIFIHPSSIVDDGASIGNGSKIWHFSHVSAKAKIGNNCNLGQNVYIANNVIIGNHVKIQNNVSVYDSVVLEDYVFCGPSMVFTNVYNPRSHIERKTEYKTTLVKKGASIGANATILCGVTIGQYALIGAGSVVLNDVPDFAIVAGVPAIFKSWVCQCGIKLSMSDTTNKCTDSINSSINNQIINNTEIPNTIDLQCQHCNTKYILHNLEPNYHTHSQTRKQLNAYKYLTFKTT